MERISNPQTLSIAEVAKMVDFPGGEIKFFSWLREKGYLLQNRHNDWKNANHCSSNTCNCIGPWRT
jgi:phage antirepressor YoqD-like protein